MTVTSNSKGVRADVFDFSSPLADTSFGEVAWSLFGDRPGCVDLKSVCELKGARSFVAYPSFALASDAGMKEMIAAKDKSAVSGTIVSLESSFAETSRAEN
ncbi:MAG: hypothetical protein ACOH12_01305 [Parvibaculaceae bacterium]